MFTCTVTGWSEFDSATIQVCEGTTGDGLTHEIQYRVDYTPPSDIRAVVRSYDLGAMFAGYLTEEHGMDVSSRQHVCAKKIAVPRSRQTKHEYFLLRVMYVD